MQLPDGMSVTDLACVCPVCKEHTCLGLTLFPLHLEESRVADSLTDARTIAVKCTQSVCKKTASAILKNIQGSHLFQGSHFSV